MKIFLKELLDVLLLLVLREFNKQVQNYEMSL